MSSRVFSRKGLSSHSSGLFPARDLLNRQFCFSLLLKWSEQMQADLVVAASQLAKQYSFTVVVPALDAVSALNERLDFSMDNVLIHFAGQSRKRMTLKMQLHDWKAVPLQHSRQYWREQLLKTLFTHHISPLWNYLHRLTGISRSVLWGNLAAYVYLAVRRKIAGK
ncbi:hypothetical protein H2C83_08880 [Thermoactinomyces sp. AMNI-1]|uniref:Aerobactin siderophore biosynthesis IucA/IucC-like C-terminal domain-containing protein n=2 Tax=Thermoactinomyces mirandus TaxID=2756294 RepID=A0A7W1XSF3_9BACL|nr:hypothetical protein [Thermoactinomyces mirandus]